MIGALVGDFITGFGSDLVGSFIDLYVNIVGPAFWAFVLLYLYIPHISRTGVVPLAIFTIVTWSTWVVVMPATVLNLMWLIVSITGGVILAIFFLARRGQYG